VAVAAWIVVVAKFLPEIVIHVPGPIVELKDAALTAEVIAGRPR
jgi:hypothetical protein